MEQLRTWMLMVIPLVILTVNLVFPRSRVLKILALSFLVLAATVHGLLAWNQIDRSLRAFAASPEPAVNGADRISAIRGAIEQYGFDAWLGLCLAIFFAAVPCNVLRGRSMRSTSKT